MNIENPTDLKSLIAGLEAKKITQEKLLIDHFNLTYESLKPINMIKSTLHEIGNSSDLKSNLLDATLGVGAGLLSKKLVVGSSNNFFKKIAGTLLEFGIATIIAKNSDKIKIVGKGLINGFFSGSKSKK
jgi:hypothetical protein